jgi:hypothetical protein
VSFSGGRQASSSSGVQRALDDLGSVPEGLVAFFLLSEDTLLDSARTALRLVPDFNILVFAFRDVIMFLILSIWWGWAVFEPASSKTGT